MKLEPDKYYHLYNRSNNNELVFKSRENYLYFLIKYRKYFSNLVTTLVYCLMPDHFHFLIYVKSVDVEIVKKNIGILLSSYTKAINKAYNRTGSLFQQHTKTKLLEDDNYLLTAITYIHQNPFRQGLVENMEDWEFSSYRDYAGLRKGTLIEKSLVMSRFNSIEEFKFFSKTKVEKIDFMYS